MSIRFRAPQINQPGLFWLNTEAPITNEALRGKMVILDFWTYGCINCSHVHPILRRMEERFGTDLMVIGVHSPKFDGEKDVERVRLALAREDIHQPVVHDPNLVLRDLFTVRAWPTLVFIDPAGFLVGQNSGEPDPPDLIEFITRHLGEPTQENNTHIDAAGPVKVSNGRFRFPSKLKALDDTRWILADSGHHQIVVLDSQGGESARFGSGQAGLRDGDPGSAQFNRPQGLAADSRAIYVADTGNHAIRRIDLESGQITTIAGNGSRGPILIEETKASSTRLASPWDLELSRNQLYFANTGSHQLGKIDLTRHKLAPIAGNGAENLVDGSAGDALLAQPSGLALDRRNQRLYFADAESSSIRVLEMRPEPHVETLTGTGLFAFGFRNGSFAEAELQHPLGICLRGQELLVADTYNGRIRRLDLKTRQVSSLDEEGFTCTDPICMPWDGEPGGICLGGPDRVLLVETNRHRILCFDLQTKTYGTWAE